MIKYYNNNYCSGIPLDKTDLEQLLKVITEELMRLW